MKLINDFFYISDSGSDESSIRYKVKFNADHQIYKAHFPGNPITPGVCLVDIVSAILEQHYGKKFRLTTLVSIKFKKAITPDIKPMFVLTKAKFEEDQFKCFVSVEDEEVQYNKMSMKYHVEG